MAERRRGARKKRPGAGRPRKPGAVSHDTRPSERADIPQHVTLRIVDGVPSLAREGLMKIIRRAIKQSQKPDFKIHEFNVLGNHLHRITTAATKQALSRGVAGLEVRHAYRLIRHCLGRVSCSPSAITRDISRRLARSATRFATCC